MKDNIFRSRMGSDSGFKTIDTLGTTPCSSNDEQVREGAHCSAFGAMGHHEPKTASSTAKKTTSAKSKTRSAKASDGMEAAIAYDHTLGGENDLPPMGAMASGKRKSAKKTTAKKSTTTTSSAKKAHASTAKKPAASKSSAHDHDDDYYVVIEEMLIIEE